MVRRGRKKRSSEYAVNQSTHAMANPSVPRDFESDTTDDEVCPALCCWVAAVLGLHVPPVTCVALVCWVVFVLRWAGHGS